ncbi:phospholipase C [Pedobacter sp. UYP30]|uniref:phosphocholine-specific phospholipase C n=1 Tax=Pedobacter sp. UYP30 TaxID=1756400 RepID=UPI003399BC42
MFTDTRRDFLKKTALLAGTIGLTNVLPEAIAKAASISAAPGTTFMDAEHVVFLMQENRSFDHMFGKLKGVRGFNDPHPHIQPDGNKVWLQKDGEGFTYLPFHVDINKTKITWQGGLPHSWDDQVDARNNGKYDKWVPVKSKLTLAHYNRQDIPFYYDLADAFTICDQHFCSALTGTTPNRLFFFTGTIRGENSANKVAAVSNSQAESRDNVFVDWPTFQETLEDNGVDWRVYQNEVWSAKYKDDETDDWCGNYGDNALEYIARHNVKLSSFFREHGDHLSNPPLTAAEVTAKYNNLSQKEKNLIDKAFTTNKEEKDYLKLEPFTYKNDEGKTETVSLPKGDIFHEFRKDVDSGKLPTVSWLVAPQRFSDHTSSPLYGTWYVSEAMNILTKNPEVWKKTIFVHTYDENDGYFDHQPPFVVPNPKDSETGKVSAGINYATDFEDEKGSPIGLGYRVPMIIASPWSKGGFVNSQVFDHTSSLMFLESWLKKKTGKTIKSHNISDWRREMCGDLTSVFRPSEENNVPLPNFLQRAQVVKSINNAKDKPEQMAPTPLRKNEIEKVNKYDSFSANNTEQMPKQEQGTKPACALPYQLTADAKVIDGKLELSFAAEKTAFGASVENKSAPFNVVVLNKFKGLPGKILAYGVKTGDVLKDKFNLSDFENGQYNLVVHGPNGFYRHFEGDNKTSKLSVKVNSEMGGLLSKKATGKLAFSFANFSTEPIQIKLIDNKYNQPEKLITINAMEQLKQAISFSNSANWYDISVVNDALDFKHRYAGKIETEKGTTTDPFMGGEMIEKAIV